MATYDDALTLRAARRIYFDANGFGEGGYDAKWVTAKLGPIPIAFPNSPERVRSVRLHDLHHVVTDYTTDWTGEGEIGAWEIASSCRDHYAAWVLNSFAIGIGVLIAPGAMFRAFVRGRQTGNLYDREFEEAMLDGTVGELRARLGLGGAQRQASAADAIAFAGWTIVAWLSLIVAATIVFGPFVLLLAWLL